MEELKYEIVFVGGIVIWLYADNPAASDIRATNDVDCVIELSSRMDLVNLESRLRSKKFRNDTSPNAPICRWIYKDIIVDVMPTDKNILGFSNKWYPEGIRHKEIKTLPDGTEIYVFPPEYFLASKFDAHKNRGGHDFRQSRDFEDIIYLLDNCSEIFDYLKNANTLLKHWLKVECLQFLKRDDLREGIECALPIGSREDSTQIINESLNRIVNM